MRPTYIVILGILLKLVGLAVPLAIVGGGGWFLLKRSAFGRALLDRVTDGDHDRDLLHVLAGHVAQLQEEVVELQERVDFAERQLSRASDRAPALPRADRPRTPPEPLAVG